MPDRDGTPHPASPERLRARSQRLWGGCTRTLRMLLYLGASDFRPYAGVLRARTVEPKGWP
jgi:hypothetical protein